MSIYYLIDQYLWEDRNKEEKNYWFCYIEELLSKLGIKGSPLTIEELPGRLMGKEDFLFMGLDELEDKTIPIIMSAVEQGCTLIGFATKNADKLFGIKTKGEHKQSIDDFTHSGYFSINNEKFLECSYIPEENEKSVNLPIFSDIIDLDLDGAEEIGRIVQSNSKFSLPGMTKYCLGKGVSYYFAFDLVKSTWVISQGRPICGGSPIFPISRTPDARVIPAYYNTTIACVDYYTYIIQALLVQKEVPSIHTLPPMPDGSIPDFLLFFSGDDDATSGEMNVEASYIMHKRNLPYHINAMPKGPSGEFVLNLEQYQIIKDRGHEIGLHYDFTVWDKFSQEGFERQHEMFCNAFKEEPVSSVAHILVMEGWAERARFQAAVGIKGDNGRSGEVVPKANLNEFNLFGYAFGTSYPYFVYDDAKHNNKRIPFVEIPMTYYEPRLRPNNERDLNKLHKCLDDSAYFARTTNLFLHPHYVTGYFGSNENVLRVLDEVEAYCKKANYTIYKCGPDKLCLWWHDRALSYISDIKRDDNQIYISAVVASELGIIVKYPYDSKKYIGADVYVDSQHVDYYIKIVGGQEWLMIPCKKIGNLSISIHLITPDC